MKSKLIDMNEEMQYICKEWISNLPKGWKADRIKDVCENLVSGGTPKSSITEFWEDGDVIWLSPTDFSKQNGKKYITDSEKKITQLGLKSSSATLIPEGTIIMSSRASIGEAKIAGCELSTNQGFISFIPNFRMHNNFLFYAIEGHLGKYFNSISSGTTFNEISKRMVKQESIPVPPIEEQKEIADYLDLACTRIDSIIAIKEKQLKTIENFFIAKITQLVKFGLDQNVKTKKTNCLWIPEINENWKIVPLKRVLEEKLKYGANESAEEENYDDPRYIRITDFGKDGKLKKSTFKSLPLEVATPYFLKEGDVLFARSGATVGKTFIFKDYNGLACFAGYLIKANCDRNKMYPEYLYYFSKSKCYEEWKDLIFTQATIQNIGADKYQYLQITLPSLEEQLEIINAINDYKTKTDSLIEKVTNQIKTLKKYRKSLIQECVTGKKQIVEPITAKQKENA